MGRKSHPRCRLLACMKDKVRGVRRRGNGLLSQTRTRLGMFPSCDTVPSNKPSDTGTRPLPASHQQDSSCVLTSWVYVLNRITNLCSGAVHKGDPSEEGGSQRGSDMVLSSSDVVLSGAASLGGGEQCDKCDTCDNSTAPGSLDSTLRRPSLQSDASATDRTECRRDL